MRGLTKDEVKSRIKKGQVNGDTNVKTKSIGEIVRTNLFTFFHAINLILFVAILLFGTIKNALFMIIVVTNAVIGIVQEIRAKFLIDRLSLISSPKAIAYRNGEEKKIPASKIVLDDILKMEAGFQVCADCVVIEGACEADESLLTGEPDQIRKSEGDELVSGSFITSGSCLVKVIHVGEDNYASKITKQAKYLKHTHSEIQTSIKRIIKTIGIALIPVGALLFCKQYFITGVDLGNSVNSTVGALIGMIPQGLVLLTSLVLAISIVRLSKKNALVQELYSIEMLARVDVLCLDKTGTLTEGSIEVTRIVGGDEVLEAAKHIATGLDDNNATAVAIRKYIDDLNEKKDSYSGDKENTGSAQDLYSQKIPFSSARKYSGIKITDGAAYVIGAPQFILEKVPDEYKEIIESETHRGNRVLLVARSEEDFGEDEHILPNNIDAIGVIVLRDVIRASAPDTIMYFTEQDVDIKIISGDEPATVSNIAKQCNVPGWENYIDASKVGSYEELALLAEKYSVFGRVTPEQKLVIIKALKDAGHTVAMTGDGVNDVMALKESDCGIAPASGSDAARNVSQIVLLDSNFGSMPSIVSEGRRAINNLQRSAALFLTKTIFAVIAAVAFLFINEKYPLEPIQISFLGWLTIGAPSFVLGLQPNKARIKENFLRNVITRSLPGGVTEGVCVIATALLAGAFSLGSAEISTISLLLMFVVGFSVLFKVCIPFDALRVGLCILMLIGFAIGVFLFPSFFGIVAFTKDMWTLFAILASAAILMYVILVKTKIFR